MRPYGNRFADVVASVYRKRRGAASVSRPLAEAFTRDSTNDEFLTESDRFLTNVVPSLFAIVVVVVATAATGRPTVAVRFRGHFLGSQPRIHYSHRRHRPGCQWNQWKVEIFLNFSKGPCAAAAAAAGSYPRLILLHLFKVNYLVTS